MQDTMLESLDYRLKQIYGEQEHLNLCRKKLQNLKTDFQEECGNLSLQVRQSFDGNTNKSLNADYDKLFQDLEDITGMVQFYYDKQSNILKNKRMDLDLCREEIMRERRSIENQLYEQEK